HGEVLAVGAATVGIPHPLGIVAERTAVGHEHDGIPEADVVGGHRGRDRLVATAPASAAAAATAAAVRACTNAEAQGGALLVQPRGVAVPQAAAEELLVGIVGGPPGGGSAAAEEDGRMALHAERLRLLVAKGTRMYQPVQAVGTDEAHQEHIGGAGVGEERVWGAGL